MSFLEHHLKQSHVFIYKVSMLKCAYSGIITSISWNIFLIVPYFHSYGFVVKKMLKRPNQDAHVV